MVTWDNYEEYICLHTDGELDDVQRIALFNFIRLHPELEDELHAFEDTRLVPDKHLVFSGKDALLRPEPKGMTISLGNWKAYSAAAGIALLLTTGYLSRNLFQEDPAIAPVASISLPAADTRAEPVTAVNQRMESAAIPATTTNLRQVQQAALASAAPVTENIKVPAAQDMEPLPSLAAEQIKLASMTDAPALTETTAPEVPVAVDQPDPKKAFLAWLPVDETKKDGFRSISTTVTGRINQARAIRENLKETTFALKLGAKELKINF
ncbi:MAG: hypothetical protein EOP50_05430 [Sphingobacteriales bacterium]|nr:MAG: hypothetical protein EOP50_05430 [Sphingobacteriales bacterium]